MLSTDIPAANFVTWWDGDLTREITDHDYSEATASGVPTISKWDPAAEEVELLRLDGTLTNNTTKGNPVLQADLFGDWREELAVRLADGSGIRIYTTTDVTDARIPTLMHDSQYRVAVAGQNSAYNQPPHPSYFIGADMAEPPVPSIAYVGAPAARRDGAGRGRPAVGHGRRGRAAAARRSRRRTPRAASVRWSVTVGGEAVEPGCRGRPRRARARG